MKIIFYLLLLVITLGCASSARILDEVVPQGPIFPADAPEVSDDVPDVALMAGPITTLPSGQIPATANGATPVVGVAPLGGPSTTLPNGAAPIATAAPDDDVLDNVPVPVAVVAPMATPVVTSPSVPSTVRATSATVAEILPLSFFMHDILGGTHPSGRVVTGIVANSDVNNLPFQGRSQDFNLYWAIEIVPDGS